MKRIFVAFAALVSLQVSAAAAAIVGPLPYVLQNGQVADAGQVMANFNKIVNDVNTNVIFPSFTQQNYYAADTGAANAIVVSVSPAPVLYAPGMVVNVRIAANNSGATTINVNGLGLQNVVNLDGSSLKSRQLLTGMMAQVVYTGSNFQLLNLSPLAVRQAAGSKTTLLTSTPGAWTFTVPAGVYSVRVEGWGAGSGGGGGTSSTGVGGGGASGAHGIRYLNVAPGDTISGVIGTGGAGGAGAGGAAGGSTTVLLNGVLQGTLAGGGTTTAASGATNGIGGVAGNATGTWSISASGQNGAGGAFGGGFGGSASSGGVGGVNTGSGCGNGGNPGGGGGGSNSNGCAGGNGWIYLEY